MGRKKKHSLSKAERAQRRAPQPRKETKKSSERMDKGFLGITPPSIRDEGIINEIKKMKVLTPYSVASKYELRISVAKDFLESLEKKGVIELVSKNRNLTIYKAK